MIPNLEFCYKTKSEELEVILCGSSNGMNSEFMRMLYESGKENNHSVVIFNYLFYDRLEKRGMGDNLNEEVDSLRGVLELCRADGYKKIKLVAKSIGGVIAGKFLKQLKKEEQEKFALVVLGYDLGWIDI